MNTFARLLLILACGLAGVTASEPGRPADDTYLAGVAAYEEGRFDEARDAFQSIVEGGAFAPELFFNLGNSEYRLSDSGRAVLNFRRALVLSPLHTESRQNLRFLENQLDFRSMEENAAAALARRIPTGWWLALTSVGFWLFAFGVATPLCLGKMAHPAIVITAISGFVLTTLGGFALYSIKRLGVPLESRAVVVAAETVANPSPAEVVTDEIGDTVLLPPGSEIQVLAERGPWLYANVDEETRGWVRKGDVEPLWPFGADLAP